MAKRIAFKVDGKVQGVWFRSFSTDQATKLGVTGFVQNNADGAVSGEAQGDESKLKEFLQHLQRGPSAAKVMGLEHRDIEIKQGESGFRD